MNGTKDADSVLSGIALSRRRIFAIPDEPLWDKLQANRALIAEVEATPPPASELAELERDQLVQLSRHRLDAAESLLSQRRRWSSHEALLAFRLLHQVDHDLLLLIPRPKLGVRAIHVRDGFERNVRDLITLKSWSTSGLLSELVARYSVEPKGDGPVSSLPEMRPSDAAQLRRDRELLRAALEAVDAIVDREFWRLAMNMRIQLWSTALLLLLLVGPFITAYELLGTSLGRWTFAGLCAGMGAAGAIVSNMLGSRPFKIPYGQTFQALLFYLFVVPVIGAAAGLLVFGIEGAGFLSALSSAPREQAAAASTSGQLAVLVLATGAGFFGDRTLRNTMGVVFDRLFGKASKETSPET